MPRRLENCLQALVSAKGMEGKGRAGKERPLIP